MARTQQKLINYNTSGATNMPSASDVNFGEIVVRYNNANPQLMIKKVDGTFATFIDSAATMVLINNAQTSLESSIETLSANVENTIIAVSGDIKTYIDTRDTYLEGLISGNTDLITDLRSDLTELSGSVSAFSASVVENYATTAITDELNTAIGNLETDLKALSSSTSAFSASVVEHYATKDMVSGVSGSIVTELQAVSASHLTLSGHVHTLSGAVYNDYMRKDEFSAWTAGTYTTDMTNMENKITELSGVTSAFSASVVTELNNIVTAITHDLVNVYRFKGSKDTYAQLEAVENPNPGDVWNVIGEHGTPGQAGYTPPGTNYAWVEDNEETKAGHWDALGGTIDLSIYATSADTDALATRVQNLETFETNVKNNLSASTIALSGAVSAFSASVIDTFATKESLNELSGVVSAFSASVIENYATKDYVTGITSPLTSRIETAEGRIDTLSGDVETLKTLAGNALSGYTLGSVSDSDANYTTQSGAKAAYTAGGNAVLDLTGLVIDCGSF